MSAKLVQIFADRGVAWSAQRIPTAVNLDFLQPEPSSSSVILMRLNGPRSRPTTFLEKLVAQGIEPGTSGSVARNADQ
jgi:hypothetical protein